MRLIHRRRLYQLQLNQLGHAIILSFASSACDGDERVHPLVCIPGSLHVSPVEANRLPKQTELHWDQGTHI